jgi:peptidoglycan/LPS O-acetylase OafA/YrhL
VVSELSRGGTDLAAAGRPDRLESLTGLRWWAAFGVFLAHIDVFLPLPGTRGLFGLGVSGVTFFFVLSGFVLTWTATGEDRPAWFYARRFARVWPLLVLAVLVPLLFALTSGMDVDRSNLVLIALASILLIQAWVPGWILEGSNPVTWTLSCEAFFYALFPLLRGPLARRTGRQLLRVAVALVVVGWLIRIGCWIAWPPQADVSADEVTSAGPMVLGTYAPIARLHEFVLGMVVATALRRGWRCPVPVRGAVALLVAGAAVLWLFRDATWRSEVPYDAVNQVAAPLFALLVAAVATRDLAGGRSWLRSRAMVRLGRWSYAFYLFHFTVVVAIAAAVFPDKQIVDFFTDPVAPDTGHAGYAVLALLVAVGLSAALYRWYEHPAETRLRRVLGRRLARTDR